MKPALQASLNRLGLDAVDLYLMHTPFAFKPGDDQDPRDVAERFGRTPAQTLLAWGIQRGTAVLTSSVNAGRISENFDVSALPESAIHEINERLTTRRRFNSVVDAGEPGFLEVPQGS